jgi:hypothetical protein
MKPQLLLGLALVLIGSLFGAAVLMAAKPADFTNAAIDGIWKESWKSGGPTITEPKLEPLSEPMVLDRMLGRWTVLFGVIPDQIVISLSTNYLVEVSGQKSGKAWSKSGQWRVISNKVVLFLEPDNLPSFIFRSGAQDYIFDPWAKTMRSELKRAEDDEMAAAEKK